MRSEETNVSKPLMTCRNMFYRRRNRDQDVYPASKGWGEPADCPTGVRHEGGVTSDQALTRNTGTCRSDVKGGLQAARRRKEQSTDAEHRRGPSINLHLFDFAQYSYNLINTIPTALPTPSGGWRSFAGDNDPASMPGR